MKRLEEIDNIMQTIPKDWRNRWCGGERGACACMGCVQIGNRLIMYKQDVGEKFRGDPEYIKESAVKTETYKKYKITKEEWELWIEQNK